MVDVKIKQVQNINIGSKERREYLTEKSQGASESLKMLTKNKEIMNANNHQ